MGDFWIEKYNPDFVNVNGQKKILEVFGDYWHNLEGRVEKDKKKIKIYKKYGYDCLVIWEHELKNNNLTNRILNFNMAKKKEHV